MNLLRSHGITRNKDEMRNPSEKPWYYEQISLGYNYRMTDIQAALGISQFSRLDKYIKKRTNIAKHYTDELDLNKVTPLEQKNDRSSSWHLYIIKVIDKSKRDGLVKVLQEHGIGTNLHYIPLYRHPYIQCNYNLSGSEQYYNSAITIPLFPNISYGDVSYIANTINSNL
jgi:dTDP-4-amino-4,6-dideoxygalactose transaminase